MKGRPHWWKRPQEQHRLLTVFRGLGGAMEKETWIIAGLGNPGGEYAHTRHNMGFEVTDLIARKLGTGISKSRCSGLTAEVTEDGRRLVLCQPQTYMNLSGRCIGELLRWYKCPPEHLLVVCDDVDLAPGMLRFRPKGSAGTHNGLRSIIEQLPEGNFPRLRVGVGSAPPEWDLADWVLGRPLVPEEQACIDAAVARAADGALDWFRHGIDFAMSHYNGKAK